MHNNKKATEIKILHYIKKKKFKITKKHWEIIYKILQHYRNKKQIILKKKPIHITKNNSIYNLFPHGLTQLYKLLKIRNTKNCL